MINYDLTKIRALFFDVDGVLSANTVPTDSQGTPLRTVNIKDGYALRLAVLMGLHVAIITGATSQVVRHRYEALGIPDVCLSCSEKTQTLSRLMHKYHLRPEEVLYMGDDIPDYKVMCQVGLPCCPADAVPEIRSLSHYISHLCGGCGCARDVIEQVLKAQGKWMADDRAFGW